MRYHENMLIACGTMIISTILGKIYVLLFRNTSTVDQIIKSESIVNFIDYWCTILLILGILGIIAILVITNPKIQKRIEKT